MGAGCSTSKAVQVADSVKAKDIHTLNQQAQEQLKLLKEGGPQIPPGTPQRLKDMIKGKKETIDITNKNQTVEDVVRLKHQELWHAVELDNTQKIKEYIDLYQEKNNEELQEGELYDQTGNSVVHKAASLGHADALMLLLERTGAKPDMVNSTLATPLHFACRNDRVDAAKFLIGCGVDVNAQDEHGQVSLLVCCIHGHFDIAKILIDASISGLLPEPIDIDVKDHRGLSPLNCAAIKGDFDLVKLLIVNGSSDINQSSPKGCSPLLYAARGGYTEIVRFLVISGASTLRQDNAGGTVLHHAIEKGHVEVLEVLQEHGIDIYSAIEIPDNAGRTPIFEAVDNLESPAILAQIIKPRKEDGFGAKVNVLNYNGQTPLFSACREGNFDFVKVLIEQCGADVDLNGGEIYKDEDDDQEGYDSLQEKFFMDAYKNCMTPLHVAAVLGYDEILLYLIEKGANPNLQTKIKGFTCLHLAVLANKPEIIIELVTKTQANPYLPDFGGRTLQDMVEIFIPSYIDSFKTLLENVQYLKNKGLQEEEENITQLAQIPEEPNESDVEGPTVARHYVNPDDERSLQGLGQKDQAQINEMYSKKMEGEDGQPKATTDNIDSLEDKKNALINFQFMDVNEIKVDPEAQIDETIEKVYGNKVAHAMNALDWKYKEIALKVIYKHTEKYLDVQNTSMQNECSIEELIDASTIAVGLTSRDKVIKVFMLSLQLLNLLTSSQKIEKQGKTSVFKNKVIEHNLVLKYLQKSEEGNTRITNKIHEALLDLSYNPHVGEAMTSAFILQRIQAHNRAGQQKKSQSAPEEKANENVQRIETEAGLGSYKGLLAQLALLYKFINSFGISSRTRGPLSVRDVLKSVLPAIQHPNQDVRNAAGKILLDLHKLSGCVTEDDLQSLSDKIRSVILNKLQTIKVEKNLNEHDDLPKAGLSMNQDLDDAELTESAEVTGTFGVKKPSQASALENKQQVIIDKISTVQEKGQSKDWQEKEVALREMEFLFRATHQASEEKIILESQFIQTCTDLLKSCLEANNMTIYLIAIDVAHYFFIKALNSQVVIGKLDSLVEPIILRCTDTNTRVRKKSVDVVFLVWNFKSRQNNELNSIFAKDAGNKSQDSSAQTESISSIIASVICEPALGEKAIIGRLGLLIKRAQPIDGKKDLVLKPISSLMGKNYEDLTRFACKWVSHKNTKVRQNALKLLTEICRINCMDPRGTPFKQRIVNFILGLRSNQRDPLIVKINEVCLKTIVANSSPGRAGFLEAYIDVNELDINIGSKARAASMDHIGAKRRMVSTTRQSKGSEGKDKLSLPQIGNVAKETQVRSGVAQPTIVLPHTEPLSEEQKEQYLGLIELFNLTIITCFFSKSWSTRKAALEKVGEQLYNLDPNRRDAMSAEINRQNLPIELNFKTFLDLVSEGIKDPVLNNYITLLELIQKALPTFFRFIQPVTIQNELLKPVVGILRKTGDMKQKIREASINFCLYLSHQSPVGPEFMVQQVIFELDKILVEKDEKDTSVAQSFGNSHMISSCLSLLNQYQVQTQILSPQRDTPTLQKKFMDQINAGLRHSNPLVRKEAEKLFKTLFQLFGSCLEQDLVNQKPQLVSKLLQSAKQEAASSENQATYKQQTLPAKNMDSREVVEKQNLTRAQNQIRDQLLEKSNLKNVIEGIGEHLQTLKLSNTKKRLQAIVEIKKAISKKIVGVKMDQSKARELFDPLSLLMRQLLQDGSNEIYLESLNLLKFIVTSLAQSMSTLDLHLMMGSFIGIIVQNSSSGNIRVQLSSDKVIVFFAKHQNIGPFVVAKEIVKNIEKINQAVVTASTNRAEVLNDKRSTLLRFYSILQLLLNQFSIVLCYQQDFYRQVLEQLADSLAIATPKQQYNQLKAEEEEVQIKQMCNQLIHNLYAIDYKLLDESVGKLSNLNRKTPLRKVVIEYEQQQKQGKGFVRVNDASTQNLVSRPPASEKDPFRDTAMSFASSTNRKSLFSPGSQRTRKEKEESPGGMGSSQYDASWRTSFKADGSTLTQTIDASSSAQTAQRRMMSLGEKRTPGTNQSKNQSYFADHPISNLTANQTASNWSKNSSSTVLPPIDKQPALNRTGILLPKMEQDVGRGLQTGYTFEYNRTKVQDQNEDVKPKTITSKFNTRSTGGAGFSSSAFSSVNKSIETPSYEPATGKRTPRRLLGNIINNQITKEQPLLPMPAVSKMPSKPEEPEPKQQAKNAKPDKPPLYVPAKRSARDNATPNNTRPPAAYVPKTGFSSDISPGAGTVTASPLQRRSMSRDR